MTEYWRDGSTSNGGNLLGNWSGVAAVTELTQELASSLFSGHRQGQDSR